jgi:RNA polymerase sigma-70 factor (ECF subfamily)
MSVDDEGLSDAELIGQMARGEDVDTALLRLIERHERRLYMFILRQTNDAMVAEEVVSSAFTALWRKAPTWKHAGASVSTWLHRVALNEAIDRNRWHKLRQHIGLAETNAIPDWLSNTESPEPTPEQRQIQLDELRNTLDAVARLPAKQRAALLLAGAGHTSADIAGIVGGSVKAAEQLLVRARRTIRNTKGVTDE